MYISTAWIKYGNEGNELCQLNVEMSEYGVEDIITKNGHLVDANGSLP